MANRDGLEATVADNKRQCLASLPGGDQVDGLPPASSTDASPAGPRAITDIFPKIRRKMTRQAFLQMQGLQSNTDGPLRKPRVRRTYSEKMTSFFEKV